jgi:hypothetical protein
VRSPSLLLPPCRCYRRPALVPPTRSASPSTSKRGALQRARREALHRRSRHRHRCGQNGVLHITTLADGTSHETFTAQGTITFVPDNPADASASGHFAIWDGENINAQNEAATSTFNAVLSGSDGSRVGVHEVFNISTSASGGTITFDKPHITCG